MPAQKFIDHNLKRLSFYSILMSPLGLIWGLIQILRRNHYRKCPGKKLTLKVISIGNITSGGSGKTPFCIYLAKKLQLEGKQVAVSHRGYKGDYEYTNKIISDRKGLLPAALRAGDEACLLAEKLIGIPVCAGRERWKSIQLLDKCFPELEYVILDDSFQHLQVQHDVNIVIFKLPNPWGNGFVLPAGILREPLSALKDADWIVVNGRGEIPEKLKKYGKPIIQGHYEFEGIFLQNKTRLKAEHLNAGLISAIGEPASFEKTLLDAGISWKFHLKYADHYGYDKKEDQLAIRKAARKHQVNYLITTEKDYVKLRNLKLYTPLAVARIAFIPAKGEIEIKL